ncbi:MAG: TonB-dependent receptor [Gemmatimonadota bacterium]|nr:TonB-dependent receptor [Gemmatimonadota bacterium]
MTRALRPRRRVASWVVQGEPCAGALCSHGMLMFILSTLARRARYTHVLRQFSLGTIILAWPLVAARAESLHRAITVHVATDLFGSVTDSASAQPVPNAQMSVTRAGTLVLNTTTDDFGRYRVHNLVPGTYSISVHALGFKARTRVVVVDGTAGSTRLDFRLESVALTLAAVEVTSSTPLAVNTRTGDQTFKQDDYHGSPTATTSQILQQTIAGAARAPTGEVHIRGQHAEYTYYIDGVPVPSGISGSLNELFDPEVVNQITFQTGGWDAEYGNKNAAVVNVSTKIPSGGFHLDASTYAGSFNSNGQSLSISTNAGRLGFFVSGARQVTDMRREAVAYDTLTFKPVNVHNHGEDIFTFGKASFSASNTDVFNLDMNYSRTRFQVPFNPAVTVVFDDRQQDVNSFVNFGWRHQFSVASTTEDAAGNTGAAGSTVGAGSASSAASEGGPSELFGGLFYRHGSLGYTPGVGDDAQFFFYPDTNTAYTLREDRTFNTTGLKFDFLNHPLRHLEFKAGVLAQRTSGQEAFQSTSQSGVDGPGSSSGLTGSDVGTYGQVAWSPIEKLELRTGLRFDAHTAPFAGTQHQVSPRVRLNYFPDAATTVYGYFGRLFVPTNVEELRTITNAGLGAVAAPTLPERDNFYELGLVHRFAVGGLVAKLSGYRKDSSPGIDDATIPGTAIVTSVNIDQIHVNGIDGVLEIRPSGPFSGYLNTSIIHAYGKAPITGGFLPSLPPSGFFDLDHDQRLSLVASGTYSASKLFISATTIYGSGLTNGQTTDGAPDASYGTGLFALNRAFKVDPSAIVNLSAGYTVVTAGAVLRPQVYIENVFDRGYLLKGAFFSGASVGRPRSVQIRLNAAL